MVVATAIISFSYAPTVANQSIVAETARTTSVFVQAVGRPDVFGSGVIVSRSGNTYTVLVAKHVVVLEDTYQITTSDKTKHNIKQLTRLPTIDIAILQFDSRNSYPVVRTGNPAQQLDQLFISGFPKPTESFPEITQTIVPGTVNAILDAQKASEGFSLRYSGTFRVGMSGGPVFNSSAELVAIHGRGDQLGGMGIPIATLVEQARQAKIPVRLGGGDVASSPSEPPVRQLVANPTETGRPSAPPSSTPTPVAALNRPPATAPASPPASGGPIQYSRANEGQLRDTKSCPQCKLDGANFGFANLFAANLTGASLRTAIFSTSTLTGANLAGVNATNSDFRGADLSGSRLQQAILSNADLTDANLSSAKLSGANLSGANLSGARLQRADLTNADLSGANLSGANLSGAILDGAKLDGAKTQGAIGLGRK
jgi:hypothetical protein